MALVKQEVEMAISDTGGIGPDGYSLWECVADGWKLKKVCAVGDAVPGDPPASEGKFIGQLRATPCVVLVNA